MTSPVPAKIDENIINLPYSKAILKIALPAILSFICQILFEFIDAYWLGKLENSEVFAAVGAASFITWGLYALMNMVSAGVNSLVARYSGGGNKDKYREIAFEGIVLSILAGALISTVMWLIHPSIFNYMGLKGSILENTAGYFSIMNAGLIILFVYNTTGIIFNAHGDTKTTLFTTAIPVLINILLAPLFILGYGFIPKMSIEGAACATVIASASGVFMRLYYLYKKDFILPEPSWKNIHFKDFFAIMKIGIPVATGNFIFCMVFPFLARFITDLHDINALSALNIAQRVEGIAYFVCMGFTVSASTMVGQYVGIRNIKKAKEAAWYNILYVSLFLVIISLIFIFFSRPLIELITKDANVIEEGMKYLRIIGYFEIFLGLEMVFQGVFTGIGNTLPASVIFITFTVGRIPAAYYFVFKLNLGSEGIWWAISISTLLKGLLVTLLFLSGFWERKFNTEVI